MYTPVILEFSATERSQRLRRQADTYRLMRGNTRRTSGRRRLKGRTRIT